MAVPTVAQTIGKYRIVKQLGAGGMGVVYEAENPDIGQRVALKVLTVDVHAQPGLYLRFVNEARAANQIKHPSVVKVYDFGQLPDGTPWMAMEFLDGDSLAARMESALSRPGNCLGMDSFWMLVELASVLTAAHAKGIVHRDLKPANVMLVPDPLAQMGERVRLLDFGIAKLHGDNLTKSGTVLGTPAYMAPEQFKSAADVDGQSDVYALGTIVYQMLSGRLPFRAQSTFEIMGAKCFDAPIPLTQQAGPLPTEVVALVMRMLEREPVHRPTMLEIEREGRRLLGLPTPRQSGWHAAVELTAGPSLALPRPAVGSHTESLDQEEFEPTSDVSSKALAAAAEALGPTPSSEKAVGEISPPWVAVPDSLSSMPSVPMPLAPVKATSIEPPLRAQPHDSTAPGAPVALAASALSSPSAPTTRDRPSRSPLVFVAGAMAVGAAIIASVALWPQAQPPRPKSPAKPQLTADPPPLAAASPAVVVAQPRVEQQPPAVVDLAPPGVALAPDGTEPEVRPQPAHIAPVARGKISIRACEPQFPSESCSFTPNVNKHQKELLLSAFKKSGTKFCPTEHILLSGFPTHPQIAVAPPSLKLESAPVFALRGLLVGAVMPSEVEIRCRPH